MTDLPLSPRAVGTAAPVPVNVIAAVAGLAVAALTGVAVIRPELGLYVCSAVGLVTSLLAAGLVLFVVVLGADALGRPMTDLVTALVPVAFAASLLWLLFDVMTVADPNGLPGLGSELSWSVVLRSGDYQSVLARDAGLLGLLVALHLAARHRPWRLLATTAAALTAASYVLTGHARSHGPAAVVITCMVAHTVAAAAWFGGLAGLATAARRGLMDGPAGARMLTAFAGLMTGVLTMLLAGGIGLAFLYLPSPRALVTTAYGEVLLIKLVVVAATLVVSTANHLRVVPAAAAGTPRAVKVLRMNVAVEQVALIAVLLVTAVLVRQNPGGVA